MTYLVILNDDMTDGEAAYVKTPLRACIVADDKPKTVKNALFQMVLDYETSAMNGETDGWKNRAQELFNGEPDTGYVFHTIQALS